MGCQIIASDSPKILIFSVKSPRNARVYPQPQLKFKSKPDFRILASASESMNSVVEQANNYTMQFRTRKNGKLSISMYPEFDYNGEGGTANGTGIQIVSPQLQPMMVFFDSQSINIPSLSSATTKFLGFPLLPFLKIEIEPESLQGTIDPAIGKVDLELKAKFLFSIGSIYKAPPLIMETTLTSEEAKGVKKKGKGERLDAGGNCRLVGVATVNPTGDSLFDFFLGLPTECLADLNGNITFQ